jgi:hypothetical protein
MINIGILIFGMTAERVLQKKVQTNITIENPVQMPKLKGNDLRKPTLPAFDMDMMLFGPGVTAVTIA